MISSRLTAWENLLDSVSHIGPLTNNPSEAKRLQVIRPDQNTPRAQMLRPNLKQNNTRRSKNNKSKNGQNRNKTSKKKNRRQKMNRTKNGKKNIGYIVSENFSSEDFQDISYSTKNVQTVINVTVSFLLLYL